jgi:hypothetical protein
LLLCSGGQLFVSRRSVLPYYLLRLMFFVPDLSAGFTDRLPALRIQLANMLSDLH